MHRSILFLTTVLALTASFAIHPAAASWPHDPHNGSLAVCTVSNSQLDPASISDGTGGMIVTWRDYRGGSSYDIYAQRISAAGVPLWIANGVAVCTAPGDQYTPLAVSDGNGGAIITWRDYRTGTNYDIYAQRVSAAGAVQWTANGVALCTASGYQSDPWIVSDGAGGAIITWYDERLAGNWDVYVQRINGSGVVQWTANGVPVCTAADNQAVTTIVGDGSGGAIVAWGDRRSGTSADLYAQRISAAGATQWTANGVALCTAADLQGDAKAVSDGAGGAIVSWIDNRDGNYDLYAQRINSAGLMQWTYNGVVVCNATGSQNEAKIISDGSGGAILAWNDLRNVTSADIYAQRISAAGAVQWTANGLALCTLAGGQYQPRCIPDGGGGAIFTWYDYRGVNYDIYAQRVSSTGLLQWTSSGVVVCSANSSQELPTLAPDGAGGAFVAWQDSRNGNYDIYAQRIERFGQLGNPEPVITSVKDVKNDQGGFVKLSWSASYLDADPVYGVYDYRVWRSVPAAALTAQALLRRGVTLDSDEAAAGGRWLVRPFASTDYAWEIVGMQSAAILPSYSMTAATTGDSIAGSNPRTAFMVEARSGSSVSADRWFSAPDSGYSVDNLPPAAPAPLTGQYVAGATTLHWNRNTEADLAGYRLYRGSSVAFVPGPANFVGALEDTGAVDAAGAPYVYKLTAVDAHGNESPVATLLPSGTTGLGDGAAPALAFAAPSPNPARGTATLRYTLSRAGHVRLSVYDAAGRRVAMLADGEQEAGDHAAPFELRDASGRTLASGLYLLQLEAEGRVLTRRLAAIR